ncbi:MAG: outer membrane beta-barrel protein [Bacteroidota bacterium]
MRHFSILICLICFTLGLQAQEGLKIGLRVSPVFSFGSVVDQEGNDISDDISSNAGISYGLNLKYGLTDNYGLLSGVHIVRKGLDRTGMVATDSAGSVTAAQDLTVTTVEIPLALRGRSKEIGSGFFITGLFGISLDITAGYKNEFSGLNPKDDVRVETGTKKNTELVNPVSASFIFGAGVEWDNPTIGVMEFGLTYHRGLINLNKRSAFDAAARGANESVFLSYLSIDVGYYF